MKLDTLAAAAAGYLLGYWFGFTDGKLRGRVLQLGDTVSIIAGRARRDDVRDRWGAH